VKITREVITDLLPAYLANAASDDTRTLVDEFFRQDPEFARMAQEKKDADMWGVPPVLEPQKDQEREALIRTKNLLRWRSHWFALSVLFTCFPLSCAFNSKGLVWIMLRDAPQFAMTCLVIAVVCWIQFYRSGRRSRASGV
jgi:hypothetical protein